MSDASSSELGKRQRDELDLRGLFGNQRDQALSFPIFLPSVVSYRWHEEASHHHHDGSCTSRIVKRDLGLLLKSVSRSKLRFPPLKRAPVETDRTSADVYMEKKSGIGLILRWM
jgi:hypothetical protein